MLFRNGEPTVLSVLLQGGDMKGVAQAKDPVANIAPVSGIAGKGGRRSSPDLHSIVRVEPTDDLTICITPSAGRHISAQVDVLYCAAHKLVRLPLTQTLCAQQLRLGYRLRRRACCLLPG